MNETKSSVSRATGGPSARPARTSQYLHGVTVPHPAPTRAHHDLIVMEQHPTLVLIGGTHGAGKTTLADLLSARLGWPVLSRDRVRAGMAWTEGETRHELG